MRLGQVIQVVGGRALNEFNQAREVEYGFETALLSDVLAHAKPHTTLIITEIVSTQPRVIASEAKPRTRPMRSLGIAAGKNRPRNDRVSSYEYFGKWGSYAS